MKYQHNKFNIALKMIFFLSLGGIVFNSISQLGGYKRECDIAEDVVLGTVTIHVWGGGFYERCTDTIIIKDINLHAERLDCITNGMGCGLRSGRIVLTDTDTLIFNGCRPVERFWWKKGNISYSYVVTIDSISHQMISDTLTLLDKDLSKRLRRDCNSLWTPDSAFD